MNDPVTIDTSNQVADSSAPDTGSAQPSQASPSPSPEQATPTPDAGSPPEQPPASPRADQQDQPPGSLTQPNTVASNTQESVDPATFKRLRDEASTFGRERQKFQTQMEQMREQMRTYQQEREERMRLAQQQKLALHDFNHPDHVTKFQPLLNKADMINQMLDSLANAKAPDGLTPEQQAQWRDSQREMIVNQVSPEERQTLQQYRQHTQQFQRDWATNPTKVLTQHVLPMIRQEFQRIQQESQARQEVQQDLEDPALKPLIEAHREEIAQAMDGMQKDPYTYAIHHAKVYGALEAAQAEIARLKQQNQGLDVRASAAAEQQRLAQGRASITKDIAPQASNQSAYALTKEWANKHKVDSMSDAFFTKLHEIEKTLARKK